MRDRRNTMTRFFGWICHAGEQLCIGFIVLSLGIHGCVSWSQQLWAQALMDAGWLVFILVGYRLWGEWINRPVITMVSACKPQVSVTTCRFERCGDAWVLRELHTTKRLLLEAGDILHVVIGASGYEGAEDQP
jgi:hypothetical protein